MVDAYLSYTYRLNHIFPNVKWREVKGTFIYCLWECTRIKRFLKSVKECNGLIIGREVPLRAKLYITRGFCCDSAAVTARWLWTFTSQKDTNGMWTKEEMACLALERLTYIVKKKENDFAHLWNPYRQFLEIHDF